MPEELLPISWFQWITSGLITGFLLVTGSLWTKLNKEQDRVDSLEKAILLQGERFNRDTQVALAAYALQDQQTDELMLRAMEVRVKAVETDYARLDVELHRMEIRILAGLDGRRQAIESTMVDGFEKTIKVLKER